MRVTSQPYTQHQNFIPSSWVRNWATPVGIQKPMQDSSRDSPQLSRGVLNINVNGGIFNQVGRDQYNNAMNDEMVVRQSYQSIWPMLNFVLDRLIVCILVCTQLPTTYYPLIAHLAKLSCTVRAGYSSGNHKPCLKGTREGVLWDIEAWEADDMTESVYWLKGVVGCGKSTIAQTFTEHSAANGKLRASFFCSCDYPGWRNLYLTFLTLAHHLAHWSPNFKTTLVPIIHTNPNVQDDSLPVQLEKLLVRPFKQTSLSAMIIIDALDECEDKEPVSQFLLALAVHVDNMPTVRFFIMGRPEDCIRSGFKLPSLRTKELPLHDVDLAIVDSDLQLFIAYQLDEIATRQKQAINGHGPRIET